MSKEPFNFNFPFVNMMPEEMGDPNLLFNSMKMMSQAWQKFANLAPQATSMALDPNELDKRIKELKAVESWLKLNLSMLSSSIHSLEIQKANLQNFNSFMGMMSEPLRASQATATTPASGDGASSPAPEQPPTEADKQSSQHAATGADEQQPDVQSDTLESSIANTGALMQEQALNWFNLLGDQFKNIVASVAAATPADVVAKAEAESKAQPVASKKTAAKKAASKKTATKKAVTKKVATKKASKTTAKTAAQRTTTSATKKATKRAASKQANAKTSSNE